ncbi:expressed unknown protein [Seminavis robusta]|uniref:Uncharacterized protein n=1 Tax=Seminavis robusta TaxID=568900 RepID=A0A9N8EIJ1_9STRA|nr:expressed unknown protein [Seminavis robusta]|eukprot:Sro1011_g231010.1 n/a (112) ;mRNA; r:12936-13271
MPPKKKTGKPKRVPHANETPLKHKAPGHGAVERAKNNMWTSSDSSSNTPQSTSNSAPARPKYKANTTILSGIGIGGGGATVALKKKDSKTSAIPTVAVVPNRANPDLDFFK